MKKHRVTQLEILLTLEANGPMWIGDLVKTDSAIRTCRRMVQLGLIHISEWRFNGKSYRMVLAPGCGTNAVKPKGRSRPERIAKPTPVTYLPVESPTTTQPKIGFWNL